MRDLNLNEIQSISGGILDVGFELELLSVGLGAIAGVQELSGPELGILVVPCLVVGSLSTAVNISVCVLVGYGLGTLLKNKNIEEPSVI